MEPIRSDRSRYANSRRSSHRSGASAESGAFAGRLEGEPETSSDEDIDLTPIVDTSSLPSMDAPTTALFDAVHAAGQRFADERTYTAAQYYREAVRRFLRGVLPDASAVEVHESSRGILSRKRYVLLTEVNRSVDRLIEGLLQSQRDQIDALARLEEIEGLLVNLVH